MGEIIIKVLQDILSFAMIEPFNYIVGLLILLGIISLIIKIRGAF